MQEVEEFWSKASPGKNVRHYLLANTRYCKTPILQKEKKILIQLCCHSWVKNEKYTQEAEI
jgi:hypothetical protein